MITVVDIKKSIDNKLMEICPNCNVYGDEVTQKIIRPCFFTRIFIEKQEMVSPNINYNHYTFIINYFSKEKTQVSIMEMLDKLRKSFATNLQIDDRYFLIFNTTTEINTDFLTFKFSLKFYDDILTKKEIHEEPKAEDISININN